jgi:hypothetical protein
MPWTSILIKAFLTATTRTKKNTLVRPDTMGKARAAIIWIHNLAKVAIPVATMTDLAAYHESYRRMFAEQQKDDEGIARLENNRLKRLPALSGPCIRI